MSFQTLCAMENGRVFAPVEVIGEVPKRLSFGRRDVIVTPVGGYGQIVVSVKKLRDRPPIGGLPEMAPPDK